VELEMNMDVFERARLTRDPRFDGRFFIGVTSTGVYCRPVCPAPSPKAKNVRYFPSAAAAADAGFRPCLRCRPEASPGTPAWLGPSASVSRALKLIQESALDDGGVETLADRLGIGSRHLRRLFLRYLGATPVSVAQTRRVHFAKKLIDETNLPMTQVAMASGFGSIRRFNATFQNLYGRAPRDLRNAVARNGHEAGHYTFRLSYRPPYDWKSLIEFLSLRATPGVERVTPGEYRRSISLNGCVGQISVRPAPGKNWLELQIRYPQPAALFRIVERVRRIFDAGADPAEVMECLGRDPNLKAMVRAYPGLRVPGCWDGFEIAVRAVLGQQVSVKGASTLAGRLAAEFGCPVPGGEGIVFPTAAALAQADLARIGLTTRRAQTIRDLAAAVAEGKLALDGSLEPEKFEEKITAIPGIGPWTAQYIAMRMGEPDAFPAGDLYLRDVARSADAWRPWRAYGAMYLWKKSGEIK
jgi:AraC family transcriptional regulator, regulatory protein of adaptative response / DNA-3-methyladenine glycosylase II